MHTGVTASWNFKLDSKSCILLQLFVVTCFRNWITRALKIKQMVPPERWKIILYVSYLTTPDRVANFCDKHLKSKSFRRLFGWCCCFRAYRLITMEWNVKRTVPCYLFLCVNFAFILITLHCDAYRRDGVVKFQTRLQKLYTSATFCRHLL